MTGLAALALRRKAERLLAPWAGPGDCGDSPGVALGLVREGRLALHLQAGLASLELGVPIGPETRFRIASVSKQFTCAAILLLAQEGRLSPEDPVRRHLPELPEFLDGAGTGAGAPVTLDHLMRNSSGLRDMLELMRLGGADLSMPCTAEHLLAAVARQRRLNFPPGSRFLYSNTGFMLLGRVVERVAGETLGKVLERRILGPLGMTRTAHTPDTSAVLPGLATGYLPKAEGGFRQAQHGFPLGGEGGLVSCIEDLALWDQALATGRVIGRGVAQALAAQARFTNGTPSPYARGLEVARHRGVRTVDHGGLWPGYRTCFLRVPELDLAIIAMANHGGVDAHGLAHRLLDAALEELPGVLPVPSLPEAAALDRLVGRWVAEDGGATTVEFARGAASGAPSATQHGVPVALAPTEDGRLVARRGAFAFTVTPPEASDPDRLAVETSAGLVTRFRRAPGAAGLPEGLAGTWRCAELDAVWSIAPAADGDGLAITVRGPLASAGPWPVTAIAPEVLRVAMPSALFQGWLDVRVLRQGEGGAVTGLSVSGARAFNLVFERVG